MTATADELEALVGVCLACLAGVGAMLVGGDAIFMRRFVVYNIIAHTLVFGSEFMRLRFKAANRKSSDATPGSSIAVGSLNIVTKNLPGSIL